MGNLARSFRRRRARLLGYLGRVCTPDVPVQKCPLHGRQRRRTLDRIADLERRGWSLPDVLGKVKAIDVEHEGAG